MSKIYNPFTGEDVEFGKADDQGSSGRKAWAASAPGYHGLIAGRKGKKVRAGMNENLRATAGTVPGLALALHGVKRGNAKEAVAGLGAELGGAAAGGVRGNTINERKGYLKPVGKVLKVAVPVQSSSPVTPIVARGRHVSSENDLYSHGRRRVTPHGDTAVRRYKGKGSKPAEGGQPIRKSLDTQQGAATRGTRGTPMSGLAQAGRPGRRLALS